MKIHSIYIKGIISLALLAIIGLQLLWLFNMYSSYREANSAMISQKLGQAIEREFLYRQEKLGGSIIHSLAPKEKIRDNARDFIIQTPDTTYVIPYNKSGYDIQRANRLAFKYIHPIDIYVLDSIFHSLLAEENIQLRNTAIENYDKDTGTTYRTNVLSRSIQYQLYETDLTYLDLLDSIGIKAYVQTSHFTIFKQMLLQLILSIILLGAVLYSLFKLSSTIFRQRKIEKVKQDFVNAMTHELKRPIASSVLMLEHLSESISESNYKYADEYANDALFALKKLNLYVEKIQEISKGEDGKLDYQKENLPLHLFFEKLKKKYEAFEDKPVSFNLNIEPGAELNTDILHFSNVTENLTENSIKYSGDSVDIEITIARKNNNIEIIHRDNGWGIPESDIPYIFDKFYRSSSSSKRKKNGFGLGLSYVKIVIENMGGSISVNSKEKEYTEFTILLPAS